MHTIKDQCFNTFQKAIDKIEIPSSFTFPFYYEPHPLSILASEQLQAELEKNTDWKHDFGVSESDQINSGKMFGVLVVQSPTGELGFLKAFSGKLANTPCPTGFVPHIYDLLPGNNFFEVGMQKINKITARIENLEQQPGFKSKKQELLILKEKSAKDLTTERARISKEKANRSAIRKSQKAVLSPTEFEQLTNDLDTESVQKKFYIKHLTEHWEDKLRKAEQETEAFYQEYENLKHARKQGSIDLQRQIFEHYSFLNANGKTKNLLEIFNPLGLQLPPAGAGDCAAPKLIQYAYKMNYTPICMAEFWWGKSPKSEIKKHKNYYPACTGKCQPILGHMLNGLLVDPNPMQIKPEANLKIEIVFEDEYLAVIHKPSGLLSAPGKSVTDSVATRIKKKYPNATGPLIVHRLDMPTSGLMLIAKSLDVHKSLQQQFIKRTIKKKYTALLEGVVVLDTGIIDLPLRVDLDNRPFQLVCFQYGKEAQTHYKVVSRENNRTRIHFYPLTGRTHQLRMHAAYKEGLNAPIVGDSMYGKKADRLHLHAGYIAFTHPISKKVLEFKVKADF